MLPRKKQATRGPFPSSILWSSRATRNKRKHYSPRAPKSMPLSQVVDLYTHLCGSTQTSIAAVRTSTYLPPHHSHDLSHDKSLAFNCSINPTIDSASQASLHLTYAIFPNLTIHTIRKGKAFEVWWSFMWSLSIKWSRSFHPKSWLHIQ